MTSEYENGIIEDLGQQSTTNPIAFKEQRDRTSYVEKIKKKNYSQES